MVRETGNTTSTQGVSALAHQQPQKYASSGYHPALQKRARSLARGEQPTVAPAEFTPPPLA